MLDEVFELKRFTKPNHNVGGGAQGLLEVDAVGRRVTWYSECGGRVLRHFHCECEPLEATFCTFSEVGASRADTLDRRASVVETSVCILLTPVHLRLHLSSGSNYDIQLPRPVDHIFAFPLGLLLQCKRSDIDSEDVPCLYTLVHPYAPVSPMALPAMNGLDESTFVSGDEFYCKYRDRVACVMGNLMCTLRIDDNSQDLLRTTAHLTLWSLVPVADSEDKQPQGETNAKAATNVEGADARLPAALPFLPFPTSMSGRGDTPSSIRSMMVSSPIMMDLGQGVVIPKGGGSGGSDSFLGFKSIGALTGTGRSPASPRQSPIHMMAVAGSGGSGSGSGPGSGPSRHNGATHSGSTKQTESPSEALAAIFGLDSVGSAAGARGLERELSSPPLPPSVSRSVLAAGGLTLRAPSPDTAAGPRRSSPSPTFGSWAHKGLAAGISSAGAVPPGGGSMGGQQNSSPGYSEAVAAAMLPRPWGQGLGQTGGVASFSSQPPTPLMSLDASPDLDSHSHMRHGIPDNAPTSDPDPLRTQPEPQSQQQQQQQQQYRLGHRDGLFSTAPDFFLRLLDTATLAVPGPGTSPVATTRRLESNSHSHSHSDSGIKVMLTGDPDSLGGILCHVTHAASNSYHCFAVETEGRRGAFGFAAWHDSSSSGRRGPVSTAAFRPLSSLSCTGSVQSVAHVTVPLGSPFGGTGGAAVPATFIQSCEGGGGCREIWLQLGSERVAALSQLVMQSDAILDLDPCFSPQSISLSAQSAHLQTLDGGRGVKLLAVLGDRVGNGTGECVLLTTAWSLDSAVGSVDVALAVLAALSPRVNGLLSAGDSNTLGGLALGVLLLASKAYGPHCSVFYLLCASLGLPFPPLPPSALLSAGGPAAALPTLSPGQLSVVELQLTRCYTRMSQHAVAVSASVLAGTEPRLVGSMVFDAVAVALQDLRVYSRGKEGPGMGPQQCVLQSLGAAIALAAAAAAAVAPAASPVELAARAFVNYHWEHFGRDASSGKEIWPCPPIVPAAGPVVMAATIAPFTRQKRLFCAAQWLTASLARVSELASGAGAGMVSSLPPPPVPAPASHTDQTILGRGLYPCPALRLCERLFYRLYQQILVANSRGKNLRRRGEAGVAGGVRARGSGWWARRVSEAFLFAAAIKGTASEAGPGFTAAAETDLSCLPFLPAALGCLVEISLLRCRERPGSHWPDNVLLFIGRGDVVAMRAAARGCTTASALRLGQAPGALASRLQQQRRGAESEGAGAGSAGPSTSSSSTGASGNAPATSDGLAEVEAMSLLRFAEDERVHEACRMLRSSRPIYLRLDKAPETSDLDHRHKLQMRLLSLCRRSLGTAVGRGMLTTQSLEPLMAEALPVPPLNLQGRVAPSNSVIQLEVATAPAELTLWPEFHNGVAAGLRVGAELSAGMREAMGVGHQTAARPSPRRGRVTRNWILYNRTAAAAAAAAASNSTDVNGTGAGTISHAGVLLALGLQGHLGVLSAADVCDYLTQGHEPTTIAVLLGLAASKRGTADSRISKTLCLHLPALLPARHWDIEISPLVQTASLVGLGLLHAGSGHRLMVEFLLAELSRKPTSDRCDMREAMTLAAAWALGVVLLGKGQGQGQGQDQGHDLPYSQRGLAAPATPADPSSRTAAAASARSRTGLAGLVDLHIEDRLHMHIAGGKRPPDSHLFPTLAPADAHSKSSRVLEGADINTDITSPGATVALALIYIRSNNADIAGRVALPQTAFAVDNIRPDLLLFRAMAHCLIMWDHVEPSASWLDSRVPSVVMHALGLSSSAAGSEKNAASTKKTQQSAPHARGQQQPLEPKVALLAFLCIVAGNCWGTGLVFAGTGDARAKDAILGKLKMLQSLRDNKLGAAGIGMPQLPFAMDKSLRPTVDMCVSVVSTALSCVMAGTGDVDCLRVIRELRYRVEDVVYGTHMALGMALGMLFLAGGNASLKRDPLSIACLVLALTPRYPVRTQDNQYHLQPLRHLYVLAVEERALRTIDADSGLPVSLEVTVELEPAVGAHTDGVQARPAASQSMTVKAPCLLPELARVRAIRVGRSRGLGGDTGAYEDGADRVNSDDDDDDEEEEEEFEVREAGEGIPGGSWGSSGLGAAGFYPTRAVLEHESRGPGLRHDGAVPSVWSGSNGSPPTVPVLVLKRRPSRDDVNQAEAAVTVGGGTEAASSGQGGGGTAERLLGLLRNEGAEQSKTEAAVCRGIETCAPLVSILLEE